MQTSKTPKNYILITPEPFEIEKCDLFSKPQTTKQNPALEGKEIVCVSVDVEGRDPTCDYITEFGAVKMKGSTITEVFSTNWKHDGTTTQTHKEYSDEMNGLFMSEMFNDFYKFCGNAIICGHNLKGFDMKFIKREGETLGYTFDNKLTDTLELAREVKLSALDYKISTLCEKLNISYEKIKEEWQYALATALLLINIYK
ncbi:MAG: 3'-5' exonuclease [Bacillota bacterium]